MGLIRQISCFMVTTLLVTAVTGCNNTTDPPPQGTSTILMTTLVGDDRTTTPQETSYPPYHRTSPQYFAPTTYVPPDETQPPYPSSQPPYTTYPPSTPPPYTTYQPSTPPPYTIYPPSTRPPYTTYPPTTPPSYTTYPPSTPPPYTTYPPSSPQPYTTYPPYTPPPYTTYPPSTPPPYATYPPSTPQPYTTYPPSTQTPELSSTTSAPCENDTSVPEFGDEEPSSSNATTTGDEKCADRGGECSTAAVCEGGKYVTGLCAGPANRKCCIKDDPKPEKFELVTREEWGSTVDRDDLTFIRLPVTEVIIHHTEGQEGCNTERCKELVRNIQAGHKTRKDKKGNFWVDIGYSFLICGDGKVYEGRGWDKQGAHTPGHNTIGIAIAFIGNFDEKLPTAAALNAAKALIEYGLANGKISPDYDVIGHRDASATTCPGDALYNLMQNSPKPQAPGN